MEEAEELIPDRLEIPTLEELFPNEYINPQYAKLYRLMSKGHSLVTAALGSKLTVSRIQNLRSEDPQLDAIIELGEMAHRAHWEHICYMQAAGLMLGTPSHTLQILRAIGGSAALKENKGNAESGGLNLTINSEVVEPSTYMGGN